MKTVLVLVMLLVSVNCFAGDVVEKVSDTQLKITSTLEPQITTLTAVKDQREQALQRIALIDKRSQEVAQQMLNERQKLVSMVSQLDAIINEAEKQGIKEPITENK